MQKRTHIFKDIIRERRRDQCVLCMKYIEKMCSSVNISLAKAPSCRFEIVNKTMFFTSKTPVQ